MGDERPGHTLQTTALVNEAYLRLVDVSRVRWQDRAHFFAMSARLMRRILVDVARLAELPEAWRRRVNGRAGRSSSGSTERGVDLVALDDALEALAAIDPRKSQVVELRFFGGLSVEETAEVAEGVGRDRHARLAAGEGLAPARAESASDRCRPDRWQQIDAVSRRARGDRRTRDDSSTRRAVTRMLRQEVESLLGYEGAAAASSSPPDGTGRSGRARARGASGAHRPVHFGDYEVVALIGAGGMGEVYRARDPARPRRRAQGPAARLTARSGPRGALPSRKRARVALNHPNIVHDLRARRRRRRPAVHRDGAVEGRDAAPRLRRQRRPLQRSARHRHPDRVARCAPRMRGIVHRDLKPENVMVRPDGLVKSSTSASRSWRRAGRVAVATRHADVLQTDAGTVVGTVAYMSPEQARGQEVDARTDIWSLGVMLYEMVAGRRPFAGRAAATCSRRFSIASRRHSRVRTGVPSELQRIVGKALRKDREQRYQVMKDCCWTCGLCGTMPGPRQEIEVRVDRERSG